MQHDDLQASNSLSIHTTFSVIATGVSPGETKIGATPGETKMWYE